MIDLHSHILPEMDDGSKSSAESAALLQMLQQQGVTTVAATPHFYAKETPEAFLKRRQEAVAKLPNSPKILGLDIIWNLEKNGEKFSTQKRNGQNKKMAYFDYFYLPKGAKKPFLESKMQSRRRAELCVLSAENRT